MALEFGNRIAVGTSTTGTGTVTLGSAVSDAFMTFAEGGITDGATVTYLLTEGNDFEIGVGTYTASGTTLSRDTVIDSKIGGTAGTTKMTLGGSAEVRIISPAETDGWVEISSASISGSPNTIVITGIPSYFSKLRLRYRDLQISTGTSNLALYLSHNGGASYFNAGSINESVSSTYYCHGEITLDGATESVFKMTVVKYYFSSDLNTSASTTPRTLSSGVVSSVIVKDNDFIDAIKIQFSSAAAFQNNGSYVLEGQI